MQTPEDFDVEQALLSACMQRSSAISDCVDKGVEVETFWTPTNQKLWLAMQDAIVAAPAGTDSIDPMQLLRYATPRAPEISLVDLTKLYTLMGTSHNVAWHAQTLLELQQRRRLAEMGRSLSNRAVDMSDDPDDTIFDLEEQLLRNTRSDESGLIALNKAIDQTELWARQNSGLGLLGLSTGFDKLDQITNGLQPGQVMILAARPSKGKSALAWQIASHIAYAGPVAYFSLEMDARSLVLRALCQETAIPISDLARNNIPPQAQESYDAAVANLRTQQLHVDERGSVTMHALKSRSKRLHRKEPLRLIVVDYLQLMTAKQATTREQEVSQISRSIKALAMDLGVPILAVAQLNRSIEMRTGEQSRPTLSDLRDSGQIEQDADIVGMVWWGWEHCADLPPNDCELIVRKNRNGPLGTMIIDWKPEQVKFVERKAS
jgi:replicative DNA helicase